jgi:hypothetical protein
MSNENKHRALYIGLGGSGVKTVLKTRRRLRERTEGDNDRQRDDAFKHLYRFVLIDTDKLTTSMEGGTSGEEGGDLSRDYVNLGPVVPKIVYDAAKMAQNRTERQRRLIEFIGTTNTKDIKPVALYSGAGAYRINSRIGLYEHYEAVKSKISEAIRSLTADGVSWGKPPDGDLNVWVVSGLAGGTGSGILLDVLYLTDRLLRQNNQNAPKIRAVLFTPGSFARFHVPEIMMSNGFSAMQELAYFLDKSNENQFKHVSVVPDDPNWDGPIYRGWPVYHSAIPIDTNINGGGSMKDTSLYENSAEMLVYLQDSAGDAASSPLDNTLTNSAGTDRLIAFGYVALRKPVQLFTRYIHERRRFEVLHAFLGKEFVASPENSRLASDWIDRVIESLIGRILTRNDALEKQFAGDNADEPSREQLDLMAARDEEQAMTQEGGDTGLNLRRSVKARFQNLIGGNETGGIDTLEELITASFNNTFYDEKGKFIKKGASQNCHIFAEEVLKRIGEAESDCLTHFRDNRSPMSEDQFRQQLKNSIRTSVNRIICDHGVAFTTGLVATCDADLDNLRQTTLTAFTENLHRMRLSLLAEIQAFPVKVESDANLLFEKAKILSAIVKELLVARFQSEVIAWLCAGDNGWLDQEVERGLADLKGEAVKVCAMARFDFEINLPKVFTASSAEETTRYLPNPVDMLSEGVWKGYRENEFSHYYASLFAGDGSLPASLLRRIGSGISITAEDFSECLFASFLPPNSGGDSRPFHRIMSILEKQISADTERAFKNNTDSEAANFLRKPLADLYRDASTEKRADVDKKFKDTDKLFFPYSMGEGANVTPIAIYGGSNQTFAKESLSFKDSDTWLPQSDSDVLMKLNFTGAFSFRNYNQYDSAKGSYESVQKKVITEGEQGHQPHVHRSFFNSAQSGENVKEAMQSLIPAAQELMGGITHPYDEFPRLFATCWLYSELLHPYRGKDVQHLPPEVLESVFEQELVVTNSAYAPVKFELSKAMVYVSWVDSADAIQTRPNGKVRIVTDRIRKRVGQFKGNVFDGFEIMSKEKDAISLILRDFERKLRSTYLRADLENGLESAIKEMRGHLPLCQADQRTNSKLAGELAKIHALLDENGILPHVRYILTA